MGDASKSRCANYHKGKETMQQYCKRNDKDVDMNEGANDEEESESDAASGWVEIYAGRMEMPVS